MHDWMKQVLVRHLAGRYFLIRKAQKWPDYRNPVETDENGAAFWNLLTTHGGRTEEAAGELAVVYGIPESEAAEDLEDFQKKVADHLGFVDR